MENTGPINSMSEKYQDQFDLSVIEIYFLGNESIEQSLSHNFEKLLDQSTLDNYFWQYCSFKVYESTYKQRSEDFFKTYLDAEAQDFLLSEIKTIGHGNLDLPLCSNESDDALYTYHMTFEGKNYSCPIGAYLNEEVRNKIYFSHKRKIAFLRELREQSNPIPPDEGGLKPLENSCSTPETETGLDFSDNNSVEKLVFLHELGILEHLRKSPPFNVSTNKLAEVVSCFTGIRQSTAQSYLNPIFSNKVDPRNNPLNPKNLKTVNEKLMKMGLVKINQS